MFINITLFLVEPFPQCTQYIYILIYIKDSKLANSCVLIYIYIYIRWGGNNARVSFKTSLGCKLACAASSLPSDRSWSSSAPDDNVNTSSF